MATVGDVRVKISANASAVGSALRKAGASFRKFAGVAAKAIKLVAIAFLGIGIAAIKAATTVEGAFRKIQVGTGATGKALNRLRGDFAKVFQDVPDAAGTVADALANVNTLFGVSGKEAQTLTRQILDFSRITGGEAGSNALQFGRAMKQFGINAKDSTDLLDTFFRITQETGISFERLTRDLREFGPVLKLANIGADEGARLIARLSAEGVNFTRVSPALRQAFINFAKEGKNARVELQSYIDRVKAAGSEGEATKILTEKFGTEVGRLAVVMRSGAFALDTNTKAIDRNRGAIKKTEEETRTFGDEMGKIRNRIVIALKPIGDAFLAMFRSILPDLEDFIQRVGKDMPRLVLKAFDALAEAATTFGPGFIQTFRGVVIVMKSIALAAVAVAIAFQKLRQTQALKNLDFEEVNRLGASLEGLKGTFSDLKASISGDVEGMAEAQETAEKWKKSILGVKQRFEAVQAKTKDTKDEVVKVEEATTDLFMEMNKLKEPADQFIGTLRVAGKEIDININNKLAVSEQKLINIRNLMGQAANAAAG